MTDEERKAEENSRAIDKEMMNREHEYKLLLLGAGESGKSTIFKQLKICYAGGFTLEDKAMFRAQIHVNIIGFMKHLCGAVDMLRLEHLTSQGDKIKSLLEWDDNADLALNREFYISTLRMLWADPAIQEAWNRRSEFFIIESHSYFFQENMLEIICSSNYNPQEAHILRVRARTSGIVENKFKIAGTKFSIIDVGGQKSERRKWMSCFDNVNGIIFVAALSEFDQFLFEDEKQNRMVDALNLFDKTCNRDIFLNTPLILFLNKKDLFQQKLADPKKQIADVSHFRDFTGPRGDYTAGVNYFKKQFMDLNRTQKDIFVVRRTAVICICISTVPS